MDLLGLVAAIGALFGTGSFGGLIIAWRKLNAEREKTKADIERAQRINKSRIRKAKVETELKIEQAQINMLSRLETENEKLSERLEKCRQANEDLLEELDTARSRNIMLEVILSDNKIPIPA